MTDTVRAHLLARAGDQRPGLLFEGGWSWTWDEVVRESVVRAAVLGELLDEGRPPHVGVLLDNTPEFSFLLGATALGGQVLVGLNTSRRGPALAADIARSDTQVVLTEAAYADLLEDTDVPVVRLDDPAWAGMLASRADAGVPDAEFGRRFGCVVVDSYSSTENAVIVQRVPRCLRAASAVPSTG